MADFPFFKMAAVRHLGFVLRVLGAWDHPRRVFGGLCDCAKFGCNGRSNFDSIQILIFCALSLKMLIHAPKIGFLVGFYPQNGEQYERDYKRRKHVVRRIDRQNRSTCAGSARAE